MSETTTTTGTGAGTPSSNPAATGTLATPGPTTETAALETSTSTAETSPTPTTPQKRPSMKQAFRKELEHAKAIETPAPAAIAQTSTTPETETPAATPTPAPTKDGPIPLAVHEKSLANARAKAAQEVEKRLREEYGEAPETVKQIVAWAKRQAADPAGFLRHVVQQAASRPDLAAILESVPKPASTAAPSPVQTLAADFRDEAGNEFFSAAQVRAGLEALRRDVLQQVQPLKAEAETLKSARERAQQQQAYAEMERETTQRIDAHLKDITALPHFKDHLDQIREAVAAAPLAGSAEGEAALLYRIYHQIVGPKLTALSQTAVIKDLQARAGASGVNPATPGISSALPAKVQAKHGGTFKDAWAYTLAQHKTP